MLHCFKIDKLKKMTLYYYFVSTISPKILHDTKALVWEWLPVRVSVTNQERCPVTDLKLSLSLSKGQHSQLMQTSGLIVASFFCDAI